ncbi:hypothetical protein [Nocardioides sp. Root140]|uniref:hypothetical protein n=1 Tax=Nocardioides sp. Root140 TaxID=1736460 RepID=UPI0006FBC500|nr:hypothetical protein [Nocardioides sp. Root140]KQY51571.1 hypothetical protein ASD30_19570 [Nocardioides sp. Root140]
MLSRKQIGKVLFGDKVHVWGAFLPAQVDLFQSVGTADAVVLCLVAAVVTKDHQIRQQTELGMHRRSVSGQ